MSAPPRLSQSERETLLQVAVDAIRIPLETRRALHVDAAQFTATLQRETATFVTLLLNGALRGCCGSVLPFEPLIESVARSAKAAAFGDARFEPLQAHELPQVELHVSLLSHPLPIHFRDETDLLAQLRPGTDGLILHFQSHQGVFLPAVWEYVPDRRDFLNRLKMKASLPPIWWSSAIRVQRFTVEEIYGRAADYLMQPLDATAGCSSS